MRSRSRPTRRNPEWSWDVLDEIWPKLRGLVPDRLMPIVGTAGGTASSVTASDRRLLSRLGVSHARSHTSRRNPVVLEHGSGYYGVVMPTRDPKWVFKLTKDKSEASFINALRNLNLSCSMEGICRYSTVYDTGVTRQTKSSSGRIYAFWRESADVAGDGVWEALGQTPRRTMARQAEQRIILALDKLRGATSSGVNIRDDQDLRAWLTQSEEMLQLWHKNPLLMDTASELLSLMEAGIVVTDIHLGNWGLVPRRPKLLTLIDPGNVIFLTDQAREAAAGIPRL